MVINISNETMDKALELKSQGLSIKSIMKELDITEDICQYGTFRSKLYRYNISKEKGIEYEDNKIEADEVDVKAYYETLKHLEKSMVKLDTKQTSVSLKIAGDKPVCIAFWGDWHIGSRGLDYEQFDKDRELIKETDGLYFIGMGDYKDNNSSYITRSSNENNIRQNMQDLLVTNMMEEVRTKAIALIRGCFLEGTPIMMSDGTYKNIEDIQEGDMVISGTGTVRKVNKKFLNQYKGQMVRFSVEGNPYEIDGTCDHKVLGLKKMDIFRCNMDLSYIRWYRLDELREGDYIAKPSSIVSENDNSIPHITINDDLVLYPIVKYSTFEYEGETHDFEVDVDHSYLVGGLVAHNCHDDWDSKIDDRDFVAELCKVTDSVNLWHGGMINVVVGSETYKIFARHKYKNESGLNTTNAQRNMLNDAGPCDIAALGHKHFPDMQMLDRMDQKVVYLRSGSYKKYDEFGQKIGGYSGKKSVPCVIVFPDSHKIVPFQELEDAIIYLKAVRKDYE